MVERSRGLPSGGVPFFVFAPPLSLARGASTSGQPSGARTSPQTCRRLTAQAPRALRCTHRGVLLRVRGPLSAQVIRWQAEGVDETGRTSAACAIHSRRTSASGAPTKPTPVASRRSGEVGCPCIVSGPSSSGGGPALFCCPHPPSPARAEQVGRERWGERSDGILNLRRGAMGSPSGSSRSRFLNFSGQGHDGICALAPLGARILNSRRGA